MGPSPFQKIARLRGNSSLRGRAFQDRPPKRTPFRGRYPWGMPDSVSIMGIDPGVTTGVSVITVPLASLTGDSPAEILDFKHGELTGSIYRQVQGLADWVIKMVPGDDTARPVMVIEDFDLDPRYHSRDKVLLTPVRMIGAMEYAHACNHFGNVTILLQGRGIAKSAATDERLREWGLYTAGSDHIRDATRQSITMIRRLKDHSHLRREVWEFVSRGIRVT